MNGSLTVVHEQHVVLCYGSRTVHSFGSLRSFTFSQGPRSFTPFVHNSGSEREGLGKRRELHHTEIHGGGSQDCLEKISSEG